VFTTSGYAGATMEAVAAKATVSPATVYLVFGSKARLLSALLRDAGSDADIRSLADRAMAESRPKPRIAAAAKVVRAIMQRERALLGVLRQAGSGRPELAAALRQVHRQQREALGGALRPLHERGMLRPGLDLAEAVATFSALASPESYWLLVEELGWAASRWERWLAETATRALLD
jgi:AcrR family transcriptional regulator